MSLDEVLFVLVGPLAVSLLVGMLLVRVSPARAWALALAAGAIAGVLGVYGWEALWPKRSEHWLLWIALVGGVGGAVDTFPACRWWVRWPMRIGVSALTLAVILRPLIDNQWSALETAAHLSGYTLATVAAWSLLAARSDDSPRGWIMLLLAGAIAGLQLVSGSSIVMAQLTAVVACAMLPLVLLAMWTHTWSGAGGGAGPMVLLIAALLVMGMHYGELQPLHAALAALAILPACSMMARDGSAWRMGAAARFAFAALLVGVPLLFAAIAYWRESKDLMGFDY